MQQYQILSDFSTEHLNYSVSSYLKDGWTPVGGVCVVIHNNNSDGIKNDDDSDVLLYSQAIAK